MIGNTVIIYYKKKKFEKKLKNVIRPAIIQEV